VNDTTSPITAICVTTHVKMTGFSFFFPQKKILMLYLSRTFAHHALSYPLHHNLMRRDSSSDGGFFFPPQKNCSCGIFLGRVLTAAALSYLVHHNIVRRDSSSDGVFFFHTKKYAHVVSFLDVCSLPQHCLTLYSTISCVVTQVVMVFFFFSHK